MPRAKVWRFSIILTEHAFDRLWLLDLTVGEFWVLLTSAAEVIEEDQLAGDTLKEVVLYLDWTRPLHVVVVVDDAHGEERLITVYEPSTDRWSDDFRTRS